MAHHDHQRQVRRQVMEFDDEVVWQICREHTMNPWTDSIFSKTCYRPILELPTDQFFPLTVSYQLLTFQRSVNIQAIVQPAARMEAALVNIRPGTLRTFLVFICLLDDPAYLGNNHQLISDMLSILPMEVRQRVEVQHQ